MRTKFLFAVLFLLLAVGIAAPLHAEETQPKLVIDIQRTASAGQYGLVHITDQFSIYNNGSVPASSLDFGFSRIYRDNVYYVDAKDKEGTRLPIDADVNKTSEFYWMRVHFARELSFNKTYDFTVTSVTKGLLTTAFTGFEYNFTAAPVLAQDARLANVTFVAVSASSFKIPQNSTYYRTGSVGGFPALVHEYIPWKAYSNQTYYVPYTSVNQYILDLVKAERDIIVSNDGALSIADHYNFHNRGVIISSLTITLPDGASNVMAYDEVGALWATPQSPSSPFQITVNPRYGMGIRGEENFTFTLTYNLPQSKYLKQLSWWGTYNLTLQLLNNREDFLFDQASVRIVAPDGMTETNLIIPYQSPVAYPIQLSQDHKNLTMKGITDQHNLNFSLTFSYIPFWSAVQIMPWMIGFEVVILAFVLIIGMRRGPEPAVPIPVEKLREFVGLYDERLALSRELIVMEEDVARGGLVKHEFRRRKKGTDLRLDELNSSLMQLKSDIRAISSHYDDLVRSIDRAEAEIEASRASMNQVRGQYRAGKITRQTYDTLVNDISRRIDRAEETVETVLITLREQAR